MAWMAAVDVIVGSNCIADDRTARFAAAEAIILRALSLAPNHAFSHAVLGEVLLHTGRGVQAIAENKRALELDHNLVEAHAGLSCSWAAGSETEAHMNEAFRLFLLAMYSPTIG